MDAPYIPPTPETEPSETLDSSELAPEESVAPEGTSGEECGDSCACAEDECGSPRLVVKRAGVETDIMFEFAMPAIIGRFDPSVGPIDVDLGGIDEGVYVSRKHAKLSCEEGVCTIADLGSSNGTYVLRDGDFAKVESAEVTDGTEIALGNARFVFRCR